MELSGSALGMGFAYHGSSMRGTFRQGDLLLVEVVPAEALRVGDVVAFRHSRSTNETPLAVHRVVARTAEGIIARGDGEGIRQVDVVRAQDVVGRVRFIRRGSHIRHVWGGWRGRLWLGYLWARRRLRPLAELPYEWLRHSGLVRSLWRPRLERVRIAAPSGPVDKYVHGRRTVACWWPEEGRFWCRKPYDLIIPPPSEGEGRSHGFEPPAEVSAANRS